MDVIKVSRSNEIMNEKIKRQVVYLKAPHVPWISCILQAVLIAFQEKLEKKSAKEEKLLVSGELKESFECSEMLKQDR